MPYKDKEKDRLRKTKRIVFKGKRIWLKVYPRTGVCSNCKRKVGEGIKQTAMHHLQYHPEDPLKDTVELCPSCHDKESWRLGCFDNRPKQIRNELGQFTGIHSSQADYYKDPQA